ncbi:hypothetical protein BU17DRAFT_62522 [Hysterangium stoloniferum]|nr:hypothetical protein BU17DRAFT_62522 [Hysterangium stoloniferum]
MESPATDGSVPPSPLTGMIRRHKVYYFDNDQVIFLVEETLFKVHRSILMRHSAVFRDMFDMPQTVGETLEGSCDQAPIRLEDVKAQDFEHLLGILYPSVIGKHVATLPEWISILQLATRWLFDDIRSLAIAELADLKIEPVQKVAIAIQCDIPEWLHSSYMALCDRPNPLTIEEARRLGLEVATQLACAREIFRDNRYRHKRDVDLSSIVSEVFGTVPPKHDDKPPELVLKYTQSWNTLPGQPWNNLPGL